MDNPSIKTETYLEGIVRWMTVYAVAGMGIFLIIKDFLIGKRISNGLDFFLNFIK